MLFRGYSQAWGDVRGETPRPLSGLPPARCPSQSHTHHTLCMALFLVPKQGSACLLLLNPLQNWDPSSTKGLQEGCHSHPQNATAGLPSYGLVWGEGATPWVAITRSPFPFGFSHSGSHLVPTLGFQRMDSGPCPAVCPLQWPSSIPGPQFPQLGRRETRGPD